MFAFPQSACSRSSNSSMLYIAALDALSCKVWIQLLSYENMQLSDHCSSANLKAKFGVLQQLQKVGDL